MSDNSAWETWKQFRGSDKALEAANGGFSWSLKCKVLEGIDPSLIDLRELYHAHKRAVALSDALENGLVIQCRSPRGKLKDYAFSPENASAALGLWRQIMIREEETASEIRRSHLRDNLS